MPIVVGTLTCPGWLAHSVGACGRLYLLLLSPAPANRPSSPHPATPATRTQVFLYPIGGVVAILPLSILLGLSPTNLMLKWYFPGR